MPDYIDRDKLLEAVEERNRNSCTGQLTYQQLKSMIENFSAADVMEVTRCKDCYQSLVIEDVLYCNAEVTAPMPSAVLMPMPANGAKDASKARMRLILSVPPKCRAKRPRKPVMRWRSREKDAVCRS